MDDEEFSNTVTMEITKIMDEMTATNTEQIDPTIVMQEVEEKKPTDFVNEYFNIDESLINTPFFDKPLEVAPENEEVKDDGIEIKNYSEVAAQDEISDTIPFVVSNEEISEADYYDDDEDDSSNTVLNVILIVLIIILLAVLGVIVFYILKAKEII